MSWPSVTPRLVANGAEQLVAFVKRVFNARGDYQTSRPTELWIGESVLLISEVDVRGPQTAFLYVYVADADATFRAAVDAGARAIDEPWDTPYGDRRGMVEDAWGNTWQIATAR